MLWCGSLPYKNKSKRTSLYRLWWSKRPDRTERATHHRVVARAQAHMGSRQRGLGSNYDPSVTKSLYFEPAAKPNYTFKTIFSDTSFIHSFFSLKLLYFLLKNWDPYLRVNIVHKLPLLCPSSMIIHTILTPLFINWNPRLISLLVHHIPSTLTSGTFVRPILSL